MKSRTGAWSLWTLIILGFASTIWLDTPLREAGRPGLDTDGQRFPLHAARSAARKEPRG
jgi:hypothetical protein